MGNQVTGENKQQKQGRRLANLNMFLFQVTAELHQNITFHCQVPKYGSVVQHSATQANMMPTGMPHF